MTAPAAERRTPSRPTLRAVPARIGAADVLGALSFALDLTEGQPLGHALRSCVIGMRVADELSLGTSDRAALYWALLLKDAGCSSNAARICTIFGSDDRAVKPRMKIVDGNDRVRMAVETARTVGQGRGVLTRLRYLVGIARTPDVTRDLIAVRCERGGAVAGRLGFPEATADAIRSLDEHWNGGGHPQGLRGEAIPLLARILNIAQTVEVFHALHGVEGVRHVLAERTGTWFDPRLAGLVRGCLGDASWWAALHGEDVSVRVGALEPQADARALDDAALDEVAAAFADIIDAKSPFTYAHSTNVARYACGALAQLGADADALRRMRRAALLHDVGKLGVSNTILDKAAALTDDERAAVQRHPAFTWEILARVEAFRDFAWLAAVHHEKLDGSGYPWGLPAERLDQAARVLVVADIYEALTANRPYRAGMPHGEAMRILERDRGTRLSGEAIDALAASVRTG